MGRPPTVLPLAALAARFSRTRTSGPRVPASFSPPSHDPQTPVAVNSISFASTIAMAVGLAAAFPQIARMLRSRSAAGQSSAGWAMGLLANTCMGYVNLRGFDAQLLAASNAMSAMLCVAAIALITRFAADDAGDEPVDMPLGREAAQGSARPVHHVLADLPTTEFVALRSAIDEVEELRAKRAGAEPALQAA